MPSPRPHGWILAAGELRIPYGTGIAAHRMILAIDPSGDVVRQINGLASWIDPQSGRWRHKPIGYLRSDRLRGYDSASHPRTFLPVHGVGLMSRRADAAIARGDIHVFASGMSEEDLVRRMAPGLAALQRINALSEGPEGGGGLPYPFLGFGRNSNSFFTTLVHAMGFASPSFARPAWLAPGERDLLLPPELLLRLRPPAEASSLAETGGHV